MPAQARNGFDFVSGPAVALLIVGALALSFSRAAGATEQFAKETGKACDACHVGTASATALTPLGEQFKANGNKLP
jgi:hypothetical protein